MTEMIAPGAQPNEQMPQSKLEILQNKLNEIETRLAHLDGTYDDVIAIRMADPTVSVIDEATIDSFEYSRSQLIQRRDALYGEIEREITGITSFQQFVQRITSQMVRIN